MIFAIILLVMAISLGLYVRGMDNDEDKYG